MKSLSTAWCGALLIVVAACALAVMLPLCLVSVPTNAANNAVESLTDVLGGRIFSPALKWLLKKLE